MVLCFTIPNNYANQQSFMFDIAKNFSTRTGTKFYAVSISDNNIKISLKKST